MRSNAIQSFGRSLVDALSLCHQLKLESRISPGLAKLTACQLHVDGEKQQIKSPLLNKKTCQYEAKKQFGKTNRKYAKMESTVLLYVMENQNFDQRIIFGCLV